MKTWTKLTLFLVLLVALAWPTAALASDLYEDQVVFGSTFILESGETLDGNLLVFGGVASLEEDSTVRGDVVVFGGTVDVDGRITGNVVGFGGPVTLGESAVVEGDVVSMGANVSQAPGAVVRGNVVDNFSGPFPLVFPEAVRSWPGGVNVPTFRPPINPFMEIVWFIIKLFLWAALAALVVLFLPDHSERTAQAAVDQPLITGGLGLLTAIILPFVLLLLIITICLIPVAFIIAVVVVMAWAFGMIALGLEVGKRLTQAFKWDWAPAASAGLGTFTLILVVGGVDALVPCVGWVVPALVGMVGFGAVLLTRLGMQSYPQEVDYTTVVMDEELPSPSPPEELSDMSGEQPPAESSADEAPQVEAEE